MRRYDTYADFSLFDAIRRMAHFILYERYDHECPQASDAYVTL